MRGIENQHLAESTRIEAVDSWHVKWPDVLASIERTGDAQNLQIDSDGWLSARQVVLAAFAGTKAVGHVGFHVAPTMRGCVTARVDTHGIDQSFRGRGIEKALSAAAVERARALSCSRLQGF